MIQGSEILSHTRVRVGIVDDATTCKAIVDGQRNVFGFVTRAVFSEAVARGQLLVAETLQLGVIGFVRFNHRVRGSETALYDIGVRSDTQRCGVGRLLVHALASECRQRQRETISLRCPEGLPSNHFYAQLGFVQVGVEEGRQRRLIVWRLMIDDDLCAL